MSINNTDIEDRLERGLDRVSIALEKNNVQLAELNGEMKQIRTEQAEHRNHDTRLTVIETRLEEAEKARKTLGENIRWLILLVITTLISVGGLAVAVLKK